MFLVCDIHAGRAEIADRESVCVDWGFLTVLPRYGGWFYHGHPANADSPEREVFFH